MDIGSPELTKYVTINSLIPVYARPPFINCFALGWNIYLAGAQNTGAINPSSSAVSIGDESRGVVAVEIMQ